MTTVVVKTKKVDFKTEVLKSRLEAYVEILNRIPTISEMQKIASSCGISPNYDYSARAFKNGKIVGKVILN